MRIDLTEIKKLVDKQIEYAMELIVNSYLQDYFNGRITYEKLFDELIPETIEICENSLNFIIDYVTYDEERFGELIPLQYFLYKYRRNEINEDDGDGFYIDKDGNELEALDWTQLNNIPPEAVFINWYGR